MTGDLGQDCSNNMENVLRRKLQDQLKPFSDVLRRMQMKLLIRFSLNVIKILSLWADTNVIITNYNLLTNVLARGKHSFPLVLDLKQCPMMMILIWTSVLGLPR